jgi:hypothetical protein
MRVKGEMLTQRGRIPPTSKEVVKDPRGVQLTLTG